MRLFLIFCINVGKWQITVGLLGLFFKELLIHEGSLAILYDCHLLHPFFFRGVLFAVEVQFGFMWHL